MALWAFAMVFTAAGSFCRVSADVTALQGAVTDRNTGNPLAGVSVGVNGCNTTTTTDANGQYSLTASQINNSPTGSLCFVKQGYFGTTVAFNVGSSETVNATLLAGGIVLQGVISDASTQLPIAGATVFPSSLSLGPGGVIGSTATPTTDAGGNYAIDSSNFLDSAAAGFSSGGLNVSASGYFTYQGSPFQIGPPYPVAQNAALIVASGIVLQGTVTDRSTSAPLAGVSVRANGCGTTTTTTDANGQYSLTASQINNSPTGSLCFVKQGYFGTTVAFNVGSSETVNATLLAGGIVLQGVISDANTQLPIAGATVFPSGLSLGPGGVIGAAPTTDAGGNYAIDSSDFLDSAATGFSSSGLNVSASPGYFTYQGPSFQIGPPFPVSINAQLNPTGVTTSVTVATSPTGLGITVDGVGYASPQIFTWVPGNPHTIATTGTLL